MKNGNEHNYLEGYQNVHNETLKLWYKCEACDDDDFHQVLLDSSFSHFPLSIQ